MQFQQLFFWRVKTKYFDRLISKLILAVVVFSSCCYLYGFKIEPNWIEVVTVNLPLPQLGQAFNGFKIVQISDLHVSNMPESRLDKIIELVNLQQPDAIAITGDLATKYHYLDTEKLKTKLNKLRSKLATLLVFGNHDHWGDNAELLTQILADTNIIHLNNQIHIIERDANRLILAGLDDPYWGNPDLPKIIAHLPDGENTVILLVHEPDYVKRIAKTGKFALQLSGHSHGGQIKLPFLKPPVLPKGAKKYYGGLNRVEDTTVYTNRGLGMTGLPYRFGSRPEITVFILHDAA